MAPVETLPVQQAVHFGEIVHIAESVIFVAEERLTKSVSRSRVHTAGVQHTASYHTSLLFVRKAAGLGRCSLLQGYNLQAVANSSGGVCIFSGRVTLRAGAMCEGRNREWAKCNRRAGNELRAVSVGQLPALCTFAHCD